MIKPRKCTHCGSAEIVKLDASPGTSFAVTVVDTNQSPPAFKPDTGVAVNLFRCDSCGNVMSFVAI